MIKKLLFYIFLGIFFFFISCKKSNLKAPVSAFMVVNNPTINTTSSTQGSNSSKITDIWYYVDDDFKGAFPVGGIMPIIGEGNHKITFFAGIKNNGISATRVPYDFYQPQTIYQNFEPGVTYTFSPEFNYATYAIFPAQALENFDSTLGVKYLSIGANPYYLISDPLKVYGGTGKSVFITMTDINPDAILKTTTSMYLPAGGTSVYLELNYKCNQPFNIGIIGGSSDERLVVTANESDEWNKIYVKLTDAVSTAPTYSYYDVIIKATKTVSSPEIYLDNIKLVTR
jgi:hypothetical protein